MEQAKRDQEALDALMREAGAAYMPRVARLIKIAYWLGAAHAFRVSRES